jgi:hypothetical protein
MSYLYRFTISYSTRGPRGTPGPIVDYFYDVRTKHKMSKARYAKVRERVRKHAWRRMNKITRRTKLVKERAKVYQRDSVEKPSRSRAKREGIKFQSVRYKYGKPLGKRQVGKMSIRPKKISHKEKRRRKFTR